MLPKHELKSRKSHENERASPKDKGWSHRPSKFNCARSAQNLVCVLSEILSAWSSYAEMNSPPSSAGSSPRIHLPNSVNVFLVTQDREGHVKQKKSLGHRQVIPGTSSGTNRGPGPGSQRFPVVHKKRPGVSEAPSHPRGFRNSMR